MKTARAMKGARRSNTHNVTHHAVTQEVDFTRVELTVVDPVTANRHIVDILLPEQADVVYIMNSDGTNFETIRHQAPKEFRA